MLDHDYNREIVKNKRQWRITQTTYCNTAQLVLATPRKVDMDYSFREGTVSGVVCSWMSNYFLSSTRKQRHFSKVVTQKVWRNTAAHTCRYIRKCPKKDNREHAKKKRRGVNSVSDFTQKDKLLKSRNFWNPEPLVCFYLFIYLEIFFVQITNTITRQVKRARNSD